MIQSSKPCFLTVQMLKDPTNENIYAILFRGMSETAESPFLLIYNFH